jgi:hypothetical protein
MNNVGGRMILLAAPLLLLSGDAAAPRQDRRLRRGRATQQTGVVRGRHHRLDRDGMNADRFASDYKKVTSPVSRTTKSRIKLAADGPRGSFWAGKAVGSA